MPSADHSPDLKRIVELSLANAFIDFLASRGIALQEPRPGVATLREPDVICIDANGEAVGIELAAGHYTGEAQNLWAHLRGTPEKSTRWMRPGESLRTTLSRGSVLVNFTDDLVANLQRTMDAHCAKNYSVPTFLLLDGRAGFLNTADRSDELVRLLHSRAQHHFVRIYLALPINWSSDVAFFSVA